MRLALVIKIYFILFEQETEQSILSGWSVRCVAAIEYIATINMSSQARGLQNFISDLRNAKSKVRKSKANDCINKVQSGFRHFFVGATAEDSKGSVTCDNFEPMK
jgi:hypothetical protein